MNNLLKTLFLIINLFSSTTSAVNNSSLPLSTDLKTGQNVSELVERDGSIILMGGTTFWGIIDDLERPCTLSFPVKTKEGRSGFLTSYTCSFAGIFVKGANNKLIQVGKASSPFAFIGSVGLDNMFISVYDDYWLDTISKYIMFEFSNSKSDYFLAMTSSTKPPFTGVDVCTFGGMNKEVACGEILEFDVNIQVPSLGNNGKKFINFANVVKVKMNKDYDLGYNGAPVYIPGQIPFTSQFIAHPVGQVVETFAQYENIDNQDKKIWCYAPIDRILQAGGLELLLGDFGGNSDDFSISDSSLEEISMVGNSSDSKLQKRQQFTLSAGNSINIRRDTAAGETRVRTCTLGFAVKKAGRIPFNEGYLTAGACASNRASANRDIAFVRNVENDVIVGTKVKVGEGYDPVLGLDYSVVKVEPNYWNPQSSMNIFIADNNPQFVPVLAPPIVALFGGQQVCFVGSYSGLVCGHINNFDMRISRNSPWRDAAGQYPQEYFQHMVFVAMATNTRAQIENQPDRDRGAPVFVPLWGPISHPAQPRQLIGARPVGIFAEYNEVADAIFGFKLPGGNVETTWFVYTPIERIIDRNNNGGYGRLELIQTP